MRHHQIARDRQPEAGAAAPRAAGERTEQIGAHRLRQAGPVIGDLDQAIGLACCAEMRTAARTGLGGIAHQVDQHAEQLDAVRPHQDRQIDRVVETERAAERPRRLGRLVHQRRQRDRREVQRRRALAGVVQRAPHQIGRAIDRLHEDFARALHPGIRVELQPLRGQQRRRQDAAQVVAHLGDHGAERGQPGVAPQRGAQLVLHRRQFPAGDRHLVVATARVTSSGSSGVVRSGSARKAAMLPVIRRIGRTSRSSTAR